MSNLEMTIYAVAAVFLVGAWFLLGKLGKLAEWVLGRLLPEEKKHAAANIVGAVVTVVMLGVYFWFGGSVLAMVVAVAVAVAVMALVDWGLTRWGVSAGVKEKAMAVSVAVVMAVALWSADKPAVEVAQAVPAVTAVAVAEDAEKIPDAMSCPCGSPAVCVGPRGGRYCVTVDGKKRYK